MTRYLHTMYRITDPEKSRAFYEALGLEFRRDMDIVRDGEKEATNYFFGVPGQEEELELTLNHDGRTYDLGTGYGHIALAVDDLERDARAAEGAGHRGRAGAVPRPRGRLASLLRPRSRRLPHRADRPQRPLGGVGEIATVPPGRAARPDPASSVASVGTTTKAPCVLGSERASHPDDERHSANPS